MNREWDVGRGMRADRLRALNVPQSVTVQLDGEGIPRRVGDAPVEVVLESWRIDDEWWRLPIVRRYVEVVLEGGGRLVLFEDIKSKQWFAQKP
jgi:hypothetical protein